MTGRLLLLSAAPLFLLVTAFAGGLQWPGGNSAAQTTSRVEGTTVSCPDGRSFTSAFELDGARFHVLGALESMEGRAAVIAGPTGDVPVDLTDSAAVSTGLVIGEPVDATGTVDDLGAYMADTLTAVCINATPAPVTPPIPAPDTDTPAPATGKLDGEHVCNRGPGLSGEFRLDIKHGTLDIKRATVASFSEGLVTITTPSGDVNVMIGEGTEVKGDLALATEIRVKGTMSGDTVQAEKVQVLCPGPAHMEDDNDDDTGETPPAVLPTGVPVPTMEPEHADDTHEPESHDDHGSGGSHGSDSHESDHEGDSDHDENEHD